MRGNTMKQFKISLLIACLISLIPLPAMAVPDTVSYQGYLTDPSGSPVDGSVSVTFALYDSAAAITASWAETQTVAVSKGLFQVQLGSVGGGGFSSNLFDIPMWLGIQVGTDLEMTPRQPLTSAGYALKAEDADSVSGKTAVMLDQSAHVSDTGNPHSVTTTQIGAAASADLTAHTANAANPHGVNAVQVGAPSSTAFNSHSSNPSAHHSRYSNSEAVSAMAVKSDTNPLHHDKYSNAQAIAAIKADAGTGLNADTVDNLHANEIIDAAQDEVRIPIPTDAATFVINTPGSYYLTGNKTATLAIKVNSSDVNIDLMGYSLIYDGGYATTGMYGIALTGQSNVIIRNGTIRDFSSGGIIQNDSSAHDNQVHNLRVINTGNGVQHLKAIYLAGKNNHVNNCVVSENTAEGIVVGGNSVVSNCAVRNNSRTGIIALSNSRVTHNLVSENSTGIKASYGSHVSHNIISKNFGVYGINASNGCLINDNTITLHDAPLLLTTAVITAGPNSQIKNNIISDNKADKGITAGDSSVVLDNNLYDNSFSDGINSDQGTVISNNSVFNSASSAGIFCLYNCSISYNQVEGNGGRGISVVNDNRVLNNHLTHNSLGLVAHIGNLIKGNRIKNSSATCIDLPSGGFNNIIEDNILTGSIGIRFVEDLYRNVVRSNTYFGVSFYTGSVNPQLVIDNLDVYKK